MIDYVIITRNKVYESEPEDILAEQLEKQKVLGLDKENYLCHFFDSPWFDEYTMEL